MVKVSVIVPIYNAEKFMKNCLESILIQTMKDFELLLIDDGSSDKSLKIIRLYAEKDKRIQVFSKQNGGASSARNYGIENAKGKYITFIDSDDTIQKDYLERLLESMEGVDIVVSGYNKINEQYHVLFSKMPKNNLWSVFKFSATWGKFYKREIIEKYNIRFENFRLGEDLVFLCEYLKYIRAYEVLNYAGYNYMFNNASLTNTIKKVQKINSCKLLTERIITVLNGQNNLIPENYIYYFVVKTVIFNIFRQRKDITANEMLQEFKENISIIQEKMGNTHYLWQKGEELSINILYNLFIFFYKLKLLKFFMFIIQKV